MKLKSLFAGVVASAMAFVACEQEKVDLGTPSIALSQEEVTLEAAGGNVEVEVTATRDWTVTIDESASEWLVVDPSAGEASDKAQPVTVSALSNEGYDREASVAFSIGMQTKYLTVKQGGTQGSADALVVYANDFDKTKAEKASSGWNTYLDTFDGWLNVTGTGAETVTYGFQKMTARTNSGNGSAGSYSDYTELGASGMNYLWFGSAPTYFAIKNITLPEGKTAYKLSFGSERYLYKATDNTFNWDEFKVYVSVDGSKWVRPEFTFAGGSLPNGRWDLASTTFAVPSGTTLLHVYFAPTIGAAYAIDDFKLVQLVQAESAGTVVLDFANGEEIEVGDNTTGGNNNGGDNTGGNTQTWPTDVFTKVTQVTSGKKYVIYADGIVAKPIEASRTYGYLNENAVTPDSDGKITTSDEYGFVFTAVEGGYTIMQSDGRFLYVADDDYKNFNVSKEPTSGHVWKVEAQSDGTFKITNVLAPKWIQFSSGYNSYGAYRETQDASFLPYLYEGTKDLTVQEGGNDGGGSTGGEDVGEDAGGGSATGDGDMESTITWTCNTGAFDANTNTAQSGTFNGTKVNNLLKLGTSSAVGSAVLEIPAGTKKIGFYAVGWKGATDARLKFSNGAVVSVKGNNGASGNPPYTVTLSDADDYYYVDVNAETALNLTVENVSKRVIIVGLKSIE